VTQPSPAASAHRAVTTHSPPLQSQSSGPTVFYRYHSNDGRVVIVDSLERVPSADRARAERVELEATPARFPLASEVVAHMDWPSFATGFGVALAVAALLSFFGRGSSRLLGFMVVAAVVLAGGGAYFGLLRRTSGQSDATFSSPGALIDDARRAVEKANQRGRDQEQLLERIQRESR
jgi:hypothetical protein